MILKQLNLGLQSVGMMRESIDPESERVVRNLNSNLEIIHAFENNPGLEENIEQSLRPAKILVQTVLSRLSLKDTKIELFEPANEEEMESLEFALSVFESSIKSLSSFANISKFPKFNKFYESHCKSRTYSFQIKKCSDPFMSVS